MTHDSFPSEQGQEIVGTLLISSRSQADCPDCLRLHIIVVLFVCLNIFTKFETNVPVKSQMLTCNNVSW